MNSVLSKSEEETTKIARKLAKEFEHGGLILLTGDLGSGKTVFTKGFASYFSIDQFQIKSPTYTYIRKYKTKKGDLYHIDLYRLEQIDELLWQEISELLEDKNNIILIEWAQKIGNKIQNMKLKKTHVDIEYINENTRKITIK